MGICDWPADERPREKLLARGPAALTDAELLAIFLRVGVAGKSAVDLARDLLERFGGLAAILHADQRAFCDANGLGPAKFAQLQAVLEMSRRHLSEHVVERDLMSEPSLVTRFVNARIGHQPHEVFACLFLDAHNRLIAFEELFRGSLTGAAVYPREVVRTALRHNAASVILAHNHPSGVAEPSRADRDITRQLSEALRLIDVRVLDHIIVGRGTHSSFAQLGLV